MNLVCTIVISATLEIVEVIIYRAGDQMSLLQSISRVTCVDSAEDYSYDNNSNIIVIKSSEDIQDYPYISKRLESMMLDEIINFARRSGIVHGRWTCILNKSELDGCWDKLSELCKSNKLDKYVICQKIYNNMYNISVTTSNFDDIVNVFMIGTSFKQCVKADIVYRPYVLLVSNMYETYIYKL